MNLHAGRMARLFLVLAAMLVASGCTNNKTSDRNLSFVEVADGQELVLGKKKLLGLAGTAEGVWVDPRTDVEYRAGHIPGAMHLPLERARSEYRKLEGYGTVVVYGNGYNSPVALAMSKTLLDLGLDDVRTLRGGLRAWETAGNPVEKGDANP